MVANQKIRHISFRARAFPSQISEAWGDLTTANSGKQSISLEGDVETRTGLLRCYISIANGHLRTRLEADWNDNNSTQFF